MIELLAEKRVQLIPPTSNRATATVAGTADSIGADYAVIVLSIGTTLITNPVGPTLSVLHSDDTVVTNHVTLTANRTLTIGGAGQHVYGIDLKSKKRYLRLTVTPGTVATNDAICFSAGLSLGRLAEAPGSTSEMVGSTNDTMVIVT